MPVVPAPSEDLAMITLLRFSPILLMIAALAFAWVMGSRLANSRATIRDLREEVAVAEATLARERHVRSVLDRARTQREARLRALDERMGNLNEYIVTLEGDDRCLTVPDVDSLRSLWD